MMRQAMRRAYLQALNEDARKHTHRLMREAQALGISATRLTLDVHGQLRADAYMRVGWEPVNEVQEQQQWGNFKVNIPVLTLTIDRWVV